MLKSTNTIFMARTSNDLFYLESKRKKGGKFLFPIKIQNNPAWVFYLDLAQNEWCQTDIVYSAQVVSVVDSQPKVR